MARRTEPKRSICQAERITSVLSSPSKLCLLQIGTKVSRQHVDPHGILSAMDKPTGDGEINFSSVGRRIAGSVIGLLVGGVVSPLAVYASGLLVLWVTGLLDGQYVDHEDSDLLVWFIILLLSVLGGATLGAAAGATITQRRMKQRSSFWRAMLLAGVGMLVGIPCVLFVYFIPFAPIMIVAGAVIGSGWKAESALSSSGMQGVYTPGDILKPQPGQARCPFCASTTFRVEQEAGLRRCSDCHSVLPNYIQGKG